MLKPIYETVFFEKNNAVDSNTLSELYNLVLLRAEHSLVLNYDDTPALGTLQQAMYDGAVELAAHYGFSEVCMSDRLAMHFFPVGEPKKMEIHADDFGDIGRKFIALLYLEAEPGAGGALKFYDPRWFNGPWHSLAKPIEVKPETNKLVIFPSFLWHEVTTYHSKFYPRMALDSVISVK